MTLTLTPYIPAGTTTGPDGDDIQSYDPQPTHKGKVQSGSQAGGDTTTRYLSIGGVERPVLAAGLYIPIGAPVPVASEQRGLGWEYEVSAIGPLGDPDLLGRRFLVVGVPAKSFATARRLDVISLD